MPITTRLTQRGTGYDYVYKDSVNTPGYRTIRNNGGLLPENPFFQSRDEGVSREAPVITTKNGTQWVTKRFGENFGLPGSGSARSYMNFGDIMGVSSDTAVFQTWTQSYPVNRPDIQSRREASFASLRVLAANKLVKKVNSHDIDLSVSMGEARETAHMVQSALLAIYTSVKRVRKGDMAGARKALGLTKESDPRKQRLRDVADKAAQTQLVLSYGVLPLMADVQGALKALDKRYEKPSLITTRASIRREYEISCLSRGLKDSGFSSPDQSLLWRGWAEVREKLTFEVDNPLLYRLSTLGLLNPMSTLHELITLSFVLDWFIPVGDWFLGMVPPQGITNVKRTSTVVSNVMFTGMEQYWRGFTEAKQWQKYKKRTVSTSIPRYHLVGAQFDLSKQQIMSGLALLWSFGASEKSQAKSYNDAVKLNKLGTAMGDAKISKQFFGNGKRKNAQPKYLFPETYAHI